MASSPAATVRRDLRSLSKCSDPLSGQRPPRRLAGHAPAGAQHVAGDGEFVGGRAGIAKGVVEDEVFEVDELAIDPEGCAGIGEVLALEEAGADR